MNEATNEKWSIRHGVFNIMSLNLTNNYASFFAISVLGATNYQIGLLSSLPPLVSMFAMIPGAIWVNRLEQKKRFTTTSILIARSFLLLVACVPFLSNENLAIWFIILIALMNFPGSMGNLSWQSMMGDIFPEKRRAIFFSKRGRILSIVSMIVTLLMGIVMVQFDKKWALPYQILFLLAFLMGMIEVYYLSKHRESKRATDKIQKKHSIDLQVIKEKPYLAFLLCALFYHFSWQIAWATLTIYQIKYAEATALWFSLFTVANSIGQIISFGWWGKMSSKYGNPLMLVFAGLGMGMIPLLSLFSTNLPYLAFVQFLSGLSLSGLSTLLFNQLLNVSNAEQRTSSIAIYNILLSLIGFFAPQLGVYILEEFNMTTTLVSATMLRIIAACSFLIIYFQFDKRKSFGKFLGAFRMKN